MKTKTEELKIYNASKKELLKLPAREWDDCEKIYDSLLIFSSGKNHDSGWKMIIIVGCIGGKPIEICCQCCDDINWKLKIQPEFFGPNNEYCLAQLRTDCNKYNILHYWSSVGKFKVGPALSSTDIEFIKK